MEISSYIMTVSTSQTGVEVFLAIRNIAGTGYSQYSRGGDFGKVEMWIIPKSKKSKEELVTQLQAVPFIQQVSVVKLSKPVTNDELLEVRQLFKGLGWDTSVVKDEDLSLFLNAKLQGQFNSLTCCTSSMATAVKMKKSVSYEQKNTHCFLPNGSLATRLRKKFWKES